MKKPTKAAVIWSSAVVAVLLVALLVAIPIVRYRIYHGDTPVFMGNPFMQKLIYHDTDVVMLYDGTEFCFSKTYHLHIVDRVGGGDSFGGGLIYAMLDGRDPQAVIEFAVAASCLKHSIEGDYNLMSVAEVESLAGGNASGRVQR